MSSTLAPPPNLPAPRPPRDRCCCPCLPPAYAYASIISLGSLVLGHSVAVVAGVLLFLKPPHQPTGSPLDLSDRDAEVLASVIMLGAALGALVAGPAFDAVGRRGTLIGVSVFFLVSILVQAAAQSFSVLVFGRGLNGVGMGMAMLTCPTFLAELSPARRRGQLVNFHEMSISLGMCLAFLAPVVFTSLGDAVGGSRDLWRWMVLVGAVPSVALLLGCLFVLPESPRFLVARNGPNDCQMAERVLLEVYEGEEEDGDEEEVGKGASTGVVESNQNKSNADPLLVADLRRDPPNPLVAQTLRDIKTAVAEDGAFRWADLCSPSRYGRILLLATTLGAFQMFVGVDSLIMFTPQVLKVAGLRVIDDGGEGSGAVDDTAAELSGSLIGTASMGVTKFFTEIVVVFVIDKIGRRPLLLGGGAVLVLANLGIGVLVQAATEANDRGTEDFEAFRESGAPWGVLVLILVYTAAFALSWGSIFWVLVSEMFPTSVRGRGLATVVIVNRAMSFAVSHTFLSLGTAMGSLGRPFFLYGGLAVAAQLFVFWKIPETKGIPLEQVSRLFRGTTAAAAAAPTSD